MPTASSSNAPSGQCFLRGRKGYFTFDRAYRPDESCRLLGCINGYFTELEIFDSHARRWRIDHVDTPHKTHLVARILAHTLYNPTRPVRIHWAPPVPYTIDELRQAYLDAVARDDDILTQFVEREALTQRLREAADFKAMVAVYRWAKTDPD